MNLIAAVIIALILLVGWWLRQSPAHRDARHRADLGDEFFDDEPGGGW